MISNKSYQDTKISTQTNDSYIEPWNVRKQAILAKYTTSEKISIVTSFLSDGEKGTISKQIFLNELKINIKI